MLLIFGEHRNISRFKVRSALQFDSFSSSVIPTQKWHTNPKNEKSQTHIANWDEQYNNNNDDGESSSAWEIEIIISMLISTRIIINWQRNWNWLCVAWGESTTTQLFSYWWSSSLSLFETRKIHFKSDKNWCESSDATLIQLRNIPVSHAEFICSVYELDKLKQRKFYSCRIIKSKLCFELIMEFPCLHKSFYIKRTHRATQFVRISTSNFKCREPLWKPISMRLLLLRAGNCNDQKKQDLSSFPTKTKSQKLTQCASHRGSTRMGRS